MKNNKRVFREGDIICPINETDENIRSTHFLNTYELPHYVGYEQCWRKCGLSLSRVGAEFVSREKVKEMKEELEQWVYCLGHRLTGNQMDKFQKKIDEVFEGV